jgi:hypothetical protein
MEPGRHIQKTIYRSVSYGSNWRNGWDSFGPSDRHGWREWRKCRSILADVSCWPANSHRRWTRRPWPATASAAPAISARLATQRQLARLAAGPRHRAAGRPRRRRLAAVAGFHRQHGPRGAALPVDAHPSSAIEMRWRRREELLSRTDQPQTRIDRDHYLCATPTNSDRTSAPAVPAELTRHRHPADLSAKASRWPSGSST